MTITVIRETNHLNYYSYRKNATWFPSSDIVNVQRLPLIVDAQLDPENENVTYEGYLDLRNTTKRTLIVRHFASVYHSWYESIGPALSELRQDKSLRVLIVDTSPDIDVSSPTLKFFKQLLTDLGIEFIYFNITDSPGFILEDFYYSDVSGFQSLEPAEELFKATRIYSKLPKNSVPEKIVYLSRGMVEGDRSTSNSSILPGLRFYDDKRIDNEKKLEEYLESRGVEIVHPENFNSVSDQVQYFEDVQTIISLSGSGLSNSIFMKENTYVIELTTALTASRFSNEMDAGKSHGEEALHHYYSVLAWERNQFYISISNKDQSYKSIIDAFEKTKILERVRN